MTVKELRDFLSGCKWYDEVLIVDPVNQGNSYRIAEVLTQTEASQLPEGVVMLCPMFSIRPK